MFRDMVDDGDLIELEEVLVNGYFIGEDGEYYRFQEIDFAESPYRLLDIWKIKKTNFRGEPPMNNQGYLELDDSQFPEERNAEWYITEGMGRLIIFHSNPF
jgi:hypothetical protein